jgi:hypothetical protein
MKDEELKKRLRLVQQREQELELEAERLQTLRLELDAKMAFIAAQSDNLVPSITKTSQYDQENQSPSKNIRDVTMLMSPCPGRSNLPAETYLNPTTPSPNSSKMLISPIATIEKRPKNRLFKLRQDKL